MKKFGRKNLGKGQNIQMQSNIVQTIHYNSNT